MECNRQRKGEGSVKKTFFKKDVRNKPCSTEHRHDLLERENSMGQVRGNNCSGSLEFGGR